MLECSSKIQSYPNFFLFTAGYAGGLKGIIYVSNQTGGADPSKVVKEYLIGETAYCVLLAQGYLTNSSGFVNLTADIKFIDLNGNVLYEKEKRKGASGILLYSS